jgi:predicted dehydrogenase
MRTIPHRESTDSTRSADRRQFLKSGTLVAGAALAGVGGRAFAAPRSLAVHNSVDETIRVGLIGCGMRGTAAAINACRADSGVKIVALADAFADRLAQCRDALAQEPSARLEVAPEQCFVGLDCHAQLLSSDVDVVLLCSPPHFRPREVVAAVAAGKHVFCEKPVAVDPPGVRAVREACAEASKHNLNIVSGLCWRYDPPVREVIARVLDGAIGDILSIQENYLTGTLWHRGRQPEWSQMEYQLRNWLYFTWLSGDHIVEQHIHSLDKALWLNGDQPPASCYGMGGRQVRTQEEFGNIYDHFACCFEWPSGVRAHSYTRQMAGCYSETEDYVVGTRGRAQILKKEIQGADGQWRYRGPEPNMYDVEHEHLFAAIRSGTPINNGSYMCDSTLMAIMGRQACYTGQRITWDEIASSNERLGPTHYEWGDVGVAAVAQPG